MRLRILTACTVGLVVCLHHPEAAGIAQDKLPNTEQLQPYQCGSIQRMHGHKGIFLASVVSAEDLAQMKERGIRTVLDLREAKEFKYDPAATAKQLGLKYVNVPFREPATLTDAVFDQARKILTDGENKPILMFCGSANRVGAIWLVHRVLDQHLSYEEALKEAKTVGLRLPAYEEKAKDYLRRQPKK